MTEHQVGVSAELVGPVISPEAQASIDAAKAQIAEQQAPKGLPFRTWRQLKAEYDNLRRSVDEEFKRGTDEAGEPTKITQEQYDRVMRLMPPTLAPNELFCPVRPGQIVRNPKRAQKRRIQREIPSAHYETDSNGAQHKRLIRMSGRQWKRLKKELQRDAKARQAQPQPPEAPNV